MIVRCLSVTVLPKLAKTNDKMLAEHDEKKVNCDNTWHTIQTIYKHHYYSCHLTPNCYSNICFLGKCWVYYWSVLKSPFTLESHNLELDIDIAGDLALLKKNLAKFKKGKHGKGLQDILIQELDWVSTFTFTFSSQIWILILTYHTYNIRWRTIGRWRLLPSWFMKHLFK